MHLAEPSCCQSTDACRAASGNQGAAQGKEGKGRCVQGMRVALTTVDMLLDEPICSAKLIGQSKLEPYWLP
jgi:hypothetical protein